MVFDIPDAATILWRIAPFLLLLPIAAYGFYNVYIHPLNKYPGPKLWAAYRFPHVLNTLRGAMPRKILEAHRVYGPVVRVAPNELSFTDAKAWPDIQGFLPNRRQNRKDFHVYGPLMPGHERQVIFANDENHSLLRKIYGPAFTPKAVEEQGDMLLKYADRLVATLKIAITERPVQDMSAFYNFVSFDLMGEFAFDEPFHCLDQGGKTHFFMNTVLEGTIVGMKLAQMDYYGIWSMLKPLIPKSFYKPKLDMDNYTAALIDRRRERGYVPGKTDVYNYVLQDKNENRLSRDELVDNGVVLAVAGSETTATLLTGTTWCLCRNPDKYKKVAQEVRSAFEKDEDITIRAVNNLPYMLAVLNEAMRVFPPTPWGFPRIVGSAGGQTIAGHHVPEDTRVAVFHYAAYRYEKNFAHPDEFIPERWLENAPATFANDSLEVLQPFHVGPRSCMGKNLAYAEMRLLLAKMLWHFDFELLDGDDDWLGRIKAYAVWQRLPLKMRLRPVSR